jgi:hypothetical protein
MWSNVVVITALVLGVRFYGLELLGHSVVGASGPLDAPKAAALTAHLEADRPLNRDEALVSALAFTDKSLTFSLDHPTSFTFGTSVRPANCAEYSYLFAAAFDAAAKVAGSTARAYRVHSADARIVGERIPFRGFGDRDWVLIFDPADRARMYIDPAFHDYFLAASLSQNVKGGEAIEIPK